MIGEDMAHHATFSLCRDHILFSFFLNCYCSVHNWNKRENMQNAKIQSTQKEIKVISPKITPVKLDLSFSFPYKNWDHISTNSALCLFFHLIVYLFIFLQSWGLNSGSSPWATPPALFFCEGFFEIRSHGTICPGCLWTSILLISASWVGRITGVSHQCLACLIFFHEQLRPFWTKLLTNYFCCFKIKGKFRVSEKQSAALHANENGI
jgi:hypothetical protein